MSALAGRVNNTGLIEAPMGTTLREIVFDIGGGIIVDRKFKAILTGWAFMVGVSHPSFST